MTADRHILYVYMYICVCLCRCVSKIVKTKMYRTVLFPECETWCLTLTGEQRLRMFENRVPRKIFGPRRREVTGEWRKIHKEELNDIYSSPNIRVTKSRRMRWVGHVAHVTDNTVADGVMVGRSNWKWPLGRPRRSWKDNINMNLQEVGCRSTYWIVLARVLQNGRDFLTGWRRVELQTNCAAYSSCGCETDRQTGRQARFTRLSN